MAISREQLVRRSAGARVCSSLLQVQGNVSISLSPGVLLPPQGRCMAHSWAVPASPSCHKPLQRQVLEHPMGSHRNPGKLHPKLPFKVNCKLNDSAFSVFWKILKVIGTLLQQEKLHIVH